MMEAGDRMRKGLLQRAAANLGVWAVQVRREKAVYHTLNKLSLDTSKKVLVAQAWVPLCAKPRVVEALRLAAQRGSTGVGTVVEAVATGDPPPTLFRTDNFNSCGC